MTARQDIAAWCAQALALDVPPMLAAGYPATLPTSGTTQRRSWLGLTGAAVELHRAGMLPAQAVCTMLDRIVAFQQPSGLFGTDGSPNTHFLLPDLAAGILAVRGRVDQDRVDGWTAALVKAGAILRDGRPGVSGPEIRWWTNGNIEVLEAVGYRCLWDVTGDQQWRAAYDTQIGFLYAPPQSGSTAGQGLQITRPAADPDGEWQDARGYLTESSGYDPDYTQVQATFLARLWEMTGDVRVLRLLNATVNTITATLNMGTMRFDGVGTRRTYPDGIVLITPAVPLLVWSGLRPDLAPLVEPSWRIQLRSAFPPGGPSEWHLRAYSSIVAGWLRASCGGISWHV